MFEPDPLLLLSLQKSAGLSGTSIKHGNIGCLFVFQIFFSSHMTDPPSPLKSQQKKKATFSEEKPSHDHLLCLHVGTLIISLIFKCPTWHLLVYKINLYSLLLLFLMYIRIKCQNEQGLNLDYCFAHKVLPKKKNHEWDWQS